MSLTTNQRLPTAAASGGHHRVARHVTGQPFFSRTT